MTRRRIARLAAASAVAVVCTLALVAPGGSQSVATGVTGGSQSAVPK